MTTYYVSPNGSNSNNGLGPDASHASNKPWLTLGKALNTGSTVVAGDTIYVGPGTYWNEALVPLATISSAGSPTVIRGDPLNAQGFKDGSGVRLVPAISWVTTRTSAEGKVGPSTATGFVMRLDTNGPAGLSFYNLMLDRNCTNINNAVVQFGVANTDILFEDCLFFANSCFAYANGAMAANRNITVRRCEIFCGTVWFISSSTAAATADADCNILTEHCLIYGRLGSGLAFAASGGNLAGGLRFKGNIIFTPGVSTTNLGTTALRVSTVAPLRIEGNMFLTCGGGPINVGTVGQIIDDGGNRILAGTTSTNITFAGTTIHTPQANLVFASLAKWGLTLPRSDFLGWTDAADATQKFSAWANTSPGFQGRTPRPWGGGASIGCWQVPDVAQDTGSAITGGGVNSVKLTGAGEISLYVPVDAVATTISVRTKSTTYGGSNFPQLIVVANPSIGIAADVSVTAAAATEETITTASFTPTAKGAVEVRLVSRSTTVTSSTYFDLLSAA